MAVLVVDCKMLCRIARRSMMLCVCVCVCMGWRRVIWTILLDLVDVCLASLVGYGVQCERMLSRIDNDGKVIGK